MDMIICFIDDSAFEHDLVRTQIAPQASPFTFLHAFTFEEVRDQLGGRVPMLFLLDLWGQDSTVIEPYITPKSLLEKAIAEFPGLDAVYEGLDSHQGDSTNEYLKRLFSLVECWRTLFETVCARLGQNRTYGLGNLCKVRKTYPGIPAVFYTRKSLIRDAVALFKAGADGLFIKPTGADDAETHRLTRSFAPRLRQELVRIVDEKIKNITDHEAYYTSHFIPKEISIEHIITSWKEFINKEKLTAPCLDNEDSDA